MQSFLITFIAILTILIISLIVFYRKVVKPSFELQSNKLTQIQNTIKEVAKKLA